MTHVTAYFGCPGRAWSCLHCIVARRHEQGLFDRGQCAASAFHAQGAKRLPIQKEFARLIPHRKDVEARIDIGVAADVQQSDLLLLGKARAVVLRVHRFDSFHDMLTSLGVHRALPRARSVEDGVRTYHRFRGYERKAREYGVVAFELGEPDETDLVTTSDVKLYGPQQRAFDLAWGCVERALKMLAANNESDYDAARNDAWENNKIQVIDGEIGTGKTFVQHQIIKQTLAAGGKMLYLFLTAQLASRQREIFGDTIDIDTFHATLGDGSDGYASPPALAGYSLVLIDECYHLTERLFRHFNETHRACDRVPAAVLAGDKHQMGAPGGTPAFLLPMWTKQSFLRSFVWIHAMSNDARIRCSEAC